MPELQGRKRLGQFDFQFPTRMLVSLTPTAIRALKVPFADCHQPFVGARWRRRCCAIDDLTRRIELGVPFAANNHRPPD
jgi:hypothetical protein